MVVTDPVGVVPVPWVGVLASALSEPLNSVAWAKPECAPLHVMVIVRPGVVTFEQIHS